MKAWKKYEFLAQELATRLSTHFDAGTEICEHNTKIKGRGTTNQIDVIWVGTINGSRRRIIIECKHYADPIEQGLIHKFVSVLDDINDPKVPTIGVFVTRTGYQLGARNLAAANDIFILELRKPTQADVEGLILKICVDVVIQTLVFSAVDFDWVTPPVEETWPPFLAETATLHLDPTNTDPMTAIPLQQLLGSELGDSLEEQMAAAQAMSTRIRADFGAAMTVVIDNTLAGTATGASALPHVPRQETTFSAGPGRQGIEHIIKDALDGTTIWFTDDGKVRPIASN